MRDSCVQEPKEGLEHDAPRAPKSQSPLRENREKGREFGGAIGRFEESAKQFARDECGFLRIDVENRHVHLLDVFHLEDGEDVHGGLAPQLKPMLAKLCVRPRPVWMIVDPFVEHGIGHFAKECARSGPHVLPKRLQVSASVDRLNVLAVQASSEVDDPLGLRGCLCWHGLLHFGPLRISRNGGLRETRIVRRGSIGYPRARLRSSGVAFEAWLVAGSAPRKQLAWKLPPPSACQLSRKLTIGPATLQSVRELLHALRARMILPAARHRERSTAPVFASSCLPGPLPRCSFAVCHRPSIVPRAPRTRKVRHSVSSSPASSLSG
jgi:hypothetical protein